MAIASLSQAGKMLQLMEDKGVTGEQIQELYGLGYLSDLFDAGVEDIDRDLLRAALGLKRCYKVQVDYRHSTRQRVAGLLAEQPESLPGPLRDLRNDDAEDRSELVEIVVMRFPRKLRRIVEVRREISALGYRPATLRETIQLISSSIYDVGRAVSLQDDSCGLPDPSTYFEVRDDDGYQVSTITGTSHTPCKIACVPCSTDREQGYYE